MDNNTALMDIVKTPFSDFAMLDVKGLPSDGYGLNLSLPGKRAMPFKATGYGFIPHLLKLAKTNPDYEIEGNTSIYGWTLATEKLGSVVKDDFILPLAAAYAEEQKKLMHIVGNPQDLMTTAESAFHYVRGEVMYEIWEQLVKQHGTNFLYYDEKGVAGIRHANGEFRIASDDAGTNNGHGRYEFRIYGAIPKETKQGIAYPVQTFELHLEDIVSGHGAYNFEKEFMEE